MIITIDTGGTKTLVSSFDNNGVPGEKYKFPTPKDQNEYLSTLLSVLKDRYKNTQMDAIVIALPGVVKNNIVVGCGNLPWKNFPLAEELSKYYSCPILMENDASLAGLSEANALKETPDLCLYLTISTGIGSGIIINGRLLSELGNSEAGHMLLEYDGKLRRWETFASGKAIHSVYGKYAYEISDDKTWKKIATGIAAGFNVLIPALQPEVIVIGGSIGTHYSKYKKTLEFLIDDSLPAFIKRPKIVQAAHPQEAVIYGCYYYAVQHLNN